MIPVTIIAAVVGFLGYLGGCLHGGARMVEKLTFAERERDEMRRRLNRIIETERPDIEAHPKLALLYAVAKGDMV